VIVYLSPPPTLEFGVVTPDALVAADQFAERFAANHYATQLEKLAEQFRRAGSASVPQDKP
jgi:hypothetical protein